MEKNGSGDHQQQPSSFSWLLDNNNRPHQSQWLQTTLAELDLKMKKILEVVEDNGDTFAQRAEMYYQKRPELIKMVEELHKSYRALADKYDLIMLRSESLRASNGCCSASNSLRQIQHSYNNSGLIKEPPDSISVFDHQSCSSDHELTKQQKLDVITSTCCKLTNTAEKKVIATSVNKSEDIGELNFNHDWEKVKEKDVAAVAGLEREGWDELLVEVSKLIEENTSKQAELIKRYNKKREDVKQLVNENRRLRDLLAQRKINVIKQTPSDPTNSNSKWKAGLLGKLLR